MLCTNFAVDLKISIHDLVDLIIKVFAVGGFFFTLYKFRQEWRREFVKKIFESKYQFSLQIVQSIADLTILPIGSIEFLAAKTKFEQYYRGPYLLVASKSVEEAMVDFKKELDHYVDNPKNQTNRDVLEAKRYLLTHTLRNDLASTWRIHFFKEEDKYFDVTKK